jgi:hypothetical protein
MSDMAMDWERIGKAQTWTERWAQFALFGAAFGFLVLAACGMDYAAHRSAVAQRAREGLATRATVVSHVWRSNSNNGFGGHGLLVAFATGGNGLTRATVDTSKAVAASFQEGDVVDIVYMRSNPKIAYLAGVPKVYPDYAIGAGLIAALVFAWSCGFLVLNHSKLQKYPDGDSQPQ